MKSDDRTNSRERALVALVAAAFALVAGLLILPRADANPASVAAPLATVTTCDNYGCGTSSTQPQINATCSLSTLSAAPGTKVTGTVNNIPAGADVSLLFDGSVVASGNADAGGQAVLSFNVPANASVGTHTVVFSGAGFSCDATGGAGFSVVAGTSQNRGSGSLSKTGIEVGVYLAIALALILVGLQLVRMARARRRHASHRHRTQPRQVVRR